jgi:hypothetical protein
MKGLNKQTYKVLAAAFYGKLLYLNPIGFG